MNEAVRNLAQARMRAEKSKRETDDLQKQIDTSALGIALAVRKEKLNEELKRIVELEEAVRMLALAIGGKNPHPAITVKTYTVLRYAADAALDYCRQHLPNALKLDKAAFEKVAKVADLDFVTITSESRATIARDLSQYVEPTDKDG